MQELPGPAAHFPDTLIRTPPIVPQPLQQTLNLPIGSGFSQGEGWKRNVWTKISGIATEADPVNWTAEDLKPYVDHALSVFGEDRVVFGGDWPPILTANSTYARWVQTLDDLTAGMGAVGQRNLFGNNARSFYHLPPG